MIDFEGIVERLLLEANTDSAGEATPSVDATDSNKVDNNENKELSDFIKDHYDSIKDAWTKKTWNKTYPLRDDSKIDQLCWDVIYGVKGTVKNVDKFDDIANIFPLIDLTAQLYDNNYKRGKLKTGADSTINAFLTNFNKLKLTRPFDYTPSHPWAKTLKEAAFEANKNELGKARIQNLPGGLGIYGTIRELMKIRKKGIFPKLTAFAKQFNGEGILKDIMFNPWKIINGKYAINDDRIKSLYDTVTVQELVNLSLAAYNLYIQQAQTTLSEESNAILKDTNAYTKFMGTDTNAVPVTWNSFSAKQSSKQEAQPTTTVSPTQVNNYFDQSFELLSKQMLNEITDPAIISRVKANVGRSAAARQSSKFGSPKPEETDKEKTSEEPNQPQAFETDKEGEYNYSLDSIKKASISPFKHPEAIELLKHFELLANYIKTKENRDILGAATQIAQAGMLGTKMAGT